MKSSDHPFTLHADARSARPVLCGIVTASLAFALGASQLHAQQIRATNGQKIDIPSETYPNPIAGVSAAGVGTEIIGEDAVITFANNNGAVRATSGGLIDLTGGSITNTRDVPGATGALKPMGVEANSGTVFLRDLSVTVTALGAEKYNAPTGLNVANSGELRAFNVDVTVTGNTTSAETGAGVKINNILGTLVLSDGSTVHASGTEVKGLMAQNGAELISFGTDVTTTGADAAGVYANASGVGGSHVALNGGTVTTFGTNSHGLYGARQSGAAAEAAGFFATIAASEVGIETSGAGSHGVFADRGSRITLHESSVKTTADATSGMVVRSANEVVVAPTSILNASDTTVLVTGHASKGVEASWGGVANLTGGSVTTTGYEGFALHASDLDSPEGTRSTINAEGVAIHTSQRAAHGANAVEGGMIHLKGGSITVLGGEGPTYIAGFTYGLNANGVGSEITSEGVAIQTHEAWSYGVHAWYGGVVEVTGGSIRTTGENAHGLSASGRSGTIISNADVTTTGAKAAGAQAYDGGSGDENNLIHLTGGTITTTGDSAAGIKAVGADSRVESAAKIVTHGVGATGALADRNGVVRITGGSIHTSSNGALALGIVNGGSVSIENATASAAHGAAFASFNGTTADLEATYTFGAGSNVSTRNTEAGVLLTVSRTDDVAGASGRVTLNLLDGAVARGNIFDTDLLETRTGYLDINVAHGAELTSNVLEGFRYLSVDGSLLGNGTLSIGDGVALNGSGYVAHDVTVGTGGTLSSDLVIRGKVVLADQYRKDASELTEPVEVEQGRQLVVEGEVTTGVDATQGTASLDGLGTGGTLVAGNWGASVGTLNGGTIEGSGESSVIVEQVAAGNVNSGTVVINNDGSGTASGGEFSVGEGAALAGNGVVHAHTTVQGALNPGNSPGELTFADGLTLGIGSSTTLEINGLDEGDYDRINVSGGSFLIEGGTLTLSISGIGNGSHTFTLFEGASPTGDFDGVLVVRNGFTFELESDGFGLWSYSDIHDPNHFYSFNVNNGELDYEVVPEPETWALLVGAGAALWLARRRRARSAHA